MDVAKVKQMVNYLKGLIDGMVMRGENHEVAGAILNEANDIVKRIGEELDKPSEKTFVTNVTIPTEKEIKEGWEKVTGPVEKIEATTRDKAMRKPPLL